MKQTFLLMFLIMMSASKIFPQKYEANWESINSRPIPQWFTDAKFGIFIHWGIYSVPAWANPDKSINIYARYAEWYWKRIMDPKDKVHHIFMDFHTEKYGKDFKYQDFAPMFKAEMFDPDQWADIFQRSGAKYVVLTSKHHEGFPLWPSKQSWNWNSVDIGPHRDLLGDLTTSVKNKGLKMGYYYSLYEWYNPLYRDNLDKYINDHMLPQMYDLVNAYEPDVFWPDGEWDHPSEKWRSTEFLAWLYNESPVKENVVVNDRWGRETRGKHGGFYTTEYSLMHDQEIGEMSHPWEECRGLGSSFGYNRNETLDDYMTAQETIELLVDKVSNGGNLLLNIGPTADGRIPVIMQQRLIEIGDWLNVNGEAIYSTTAWPGRKNQKTDGSVFYTAKGSDLYVICTKWPEKNLVISGLSSNPNVSLLGSKQNVRNSLKGNNVTITPPQVPLSETKLQHAYVFKLANALR
jgi:alpha-L-fucosidase